MPFIRHRFAHAKIVPVLIGDQSPGGAEEVAKAVLHAVRATGRQIIVIASGDGSHYVPRARAEHDDRAVLAAVSELDTAQFYRTLALLRPSMCGYGCIAAMVLISKALGATSARLLAYTTSGDIDAGNDARVVGYAAMEVI